MNIRHAQGMHHEKVPLIKQGQFLKTAFSKSYDQPKMSSKSQSSTSENFDRLNVSNGLDGVLNKYFDKLTIAILGGFFLGAFNSSNGKNLNILEVPEEEFKERKAKALSFGIKDSQLRYIDFISAYMMDDRSSCIINDFYKTSSYHRSAIVEKFGINPVSSYKKKNYYIDALILKECEERGLLLSKADPKIVLTSSYFAKSVMRGADVSFLDLHKLVLLDYGLTLKEVFQSDSIEELYNQFGRFKNEIFNYANIMRPDNLINMSRNNSNAPNVSEFLLQLRQRELLPTENFPYLHITSSLQLDKIIASHFRLEPSQVTFLKKLILTGDPIKSIQGQAVTDRKLQQEAAYLRMLELKSALISTDTIAHLEALKDFFEENISDEQISSSSIKGSKEKILLFKNSKSIDEFKEIVGDLDYSYYSTRDMLYNAMSAKHFGVLHLFGKAWAKPEELLAVAKLYGLKQAVQRLA